MREGAFFSEKESPLPYPPRRKPAGMEKTAQAKRGCSQSERVFPVKKKPNKRWPGDSRPFSFEPMQFQGFCAAGRKTAFGVPSIRRGGIIRPISSARRNMLLFDSKPFSFEPMQFQAFCAAGRKTAFGVPSIRRGGYHPPAVICCFFPLFRHVRTTFFRADTIRPYETKRLNIFITRLNGSVEGRPWLVFP